MSAARAQVDTRSVDVLRRIRRTPPAPPPGEVCELCAEPITPEHRHVMQVERRRLLCSCRGCALLFEPRGAAGGRYRAVPEDRTALPTGALPRRLWEGLSIPVGLAFFFTCSPLARAVAFYPGPAGATESLLELDQWGEITAVDPAVADMQADVQALLVRDPGDPEPLEAYVVGIDRCYELVGRLRLTWHGFDGGSEARAAITELFDDLATRRAPRHRAGGRAPTGAPS